ncbi:sensor histidine kinase [Aurantimonas coralicida]|nr:sensor histidine kinase [Aurantimonas coralicida]
MQILIDDGPEAALLCIVSQEGAGPSTGKCLAQVFAAEPDWARLPVLFLVANSQKPPPAVRLLDDLPEVPPFLVFGRPCRPAVLRHAIDVQAEARRRQFETRDLLEKLASEEQRSRFLLSELRHRTRNSLSVLRALFTMSARHARTIEELKISFGERLNNLSAANGRLSEEGAGRVGLSDLINEHVQPYTIAPDQLRLSGPEAYLDERTAFDFALVVHELATNAAKYGALSQANGRIEVDLVRESEAELLRLTWRERGGPSVATPTRQGLGSRLISGFAPGNRGAQIEFDTDGLVWTGWIPSEGQSAT